MAQEMDIQLQQVMDEAASRKKVGIVLSMQAMEKLQTKAEAMGMSRNEFIRQVLYGIAFKEELAAA